MPSGAIADPKNGLLKTSRNVIHDDNKEEYKKRRALVHHRDDSIEVSAAAYTHLFDTSLYAIVENSHPLYEFLRLAKARCRQAEDIEKVFLINDEDGHLLNITVSETETALRKMKSGKATGPDDLSADLWKSKGWCPADWLTEFFNQVVAEKKVPKSWQQSTIWKKDHPDLEEEGQSCRLFQLPSNSFPFVQHENL
ncbi:unnamed protein product [Heligmosomoides polygyrus]|uniref:PB1 domain-containing protein n=1 Tax=Heligmosomoides polygyrus TaxID=6339 RepID=A0A183FMM1_HELPZ|nr:unnamed protein product [Heligmosomoides polygyrus]